MSESCTVEIYENQVLDRFKLSIFWHSYEAQEWSVKSAPALDPSLLNTSVAPDEVETPAGSGLFSNQSVLS